MSNKYDFEMNVNDNDSHYLILKQIKPNSKVLEFGSANGKMTKYMKEELSCDVYITEVVESSFNEAMQFAKDGVFGDIEELEWANKFSSVDFDYIIFADVLEHLKAPEIVLKKANTLLKADGKIIVSVPNVAHAGVLAELYNNNFHYRELGLLDKTHLQMFSYASLCQMIEDCGNVIEIYDATYLPIENTEFSEYKNALSNEILNSIEGKTFAEVYQFVFTLLKEENHSDIVAENKLKAKKPLVSKVHFNCGTDVNFESVIEADNCLEFEFDVPEQTTAAQVFPATQRCILKNIEIYADGKKSTYYKTNGVDCIDGLVFNFNCPRLDIRTREVKKIKVKMDIIFVNETLADILLSELSLSKSYEERLYKNNKLSKEKDDFLKHEKNSVKELKSKVNDLKNEKNSIECSYNTIVNSFFWRSTRPMRFFVDILKKILHKNKYTSLGLKAIRSAKNNGVRATMKKVNTRLFKRHINTHSISKAERTAQEKTVFKNAVKISIVVPLYNTPEKFLKEMIDSVKAQTYKNWELCMADGSDAEHSNVKAICLNYAKNDSRIKYKVLEENLGISDNTNECIEMATGDYIGLFDHDDLLHPSALFEMLKAINDSKDGVDFLYTDEDKTDENGKRFFDAIYKPDFSPDLLRCQNYICHFTVFRKSMLDEIGMFRGEYNGSQDHDLILRLTEKTDKIVHISKVLYHWRVHSASTAGGAGAKTYTMEAGVKAVQSHIDRIGLAGKVEHGMFPNSYRPIYEIKGTPKVSILIPNKDHKEDLELCLQSVFNSTYDNYEVIVIENNSTTEEIKAYYEEIEKIDNVKVVTWEKGFNYSAINNFGAKYATGEYYVLLNNDIELITPNWIEEMLMYCQREDVGIVGAKLYYPDETIQHAGVIIGLGGIAGHAHLGKTRQDPSYFGRAKAIQNLSAVTAACLMISKDVFEEVHGLDEAFAVAFNDVDLCLKVVESGHLIVFTPYMEAYHYESKSRGYEDSPEKKKRFNGEIDRFEKKWNYFLQKGDPYYNKNLSLNGTSDFVEK